MPELLWDSSGLVKRYFRETGTPIANALFTYTPALLMTVPYMVYTEACAALRRKRNSGLLTHAAYTAARISIEQGILLNPTVRMLTIEDADVLQGITLSERHNINSTDAAILAALMRYLASRPAGSPKYTLVATDRNLIRAASAEGFPVLDPEYLVPADVPAFLSSL